MRCAWHAGWADLGMSLFAPRQACRASWCSTPWAAAPARAWARLLLERLSVDYGKKSKLGFTVYPSPQVRCPGCPCLLGAPVQAHAGNNGKLPGLAPSLPSRAGCNN